LPSRACGRPYAGRWSPPPTTHCPRLIVRRTGEGRCCQGRLLLSSRRQRPGERHDPSIPISAPKSPHRNRTRRDRKVMASAAQTLKRSRWQLGEPNDAGIAARRRRSKKARDRHLRDGGAFQEFRRQSASADTSGPSCGHESSIVTKSATSWWRSRRTRGRPDGINGRGHQAEGRCRYKMQFYERSS